ncbi:META domain-containing protein [Paraburkholderia adhaesiva]|uniref:META domain-containing protein n=1 Tax=Paraburkholderia adhaesiva TaxID=2883244 RepID=UPI001F3E9276|nr:META domain-containing protein [Paraburkholderia adhaesiva]
MRLIASRIAPFAAALLLAACTMPVHDYASAPPSDPFVPAATQLLDNTQWQLVEWKQADGTLRAVPGAAANGVAGGHPITLDLSTETGQRRVSGFSGCNRYTGSYTLKNGLLSFGQMAGTRMACVGLGGDIEGAFLDALSHIARSGVQMREPRSLLLILENGDRLTFKHPDGAAATQPAQ